MSMWIKQDTEQCVCSDPRFKKQEVKIKNHNKKYQYLGIFLFRTIGEKPNLSSILPFFKYIL